MAKMIGQTKSWLWWVAGFVCALVFGKNTCAGEMAKPKYGVNIAPPPVEQPVANAEDVKKAEKLLADYLAPALAEPSAEQKATTEKLIKDFGSPDFKTREDASVAIVKVGQAALGQLREAAKSKDPEVASRSETAIKGIEDAARSGVADELKKLGSAGQSAVMKQLGEANTARNQALQAAEQAKTSGKADEAAKFTKEAEAAGVRAQALNALFRQLVPRKNPGEMAPVYGIRPALD